MSLRGKNTWCLALIAGIFCLMSFASAQNVSVDYPSSVNVGEVFYADIVLLNFPQDIYDIKIDIFNSSGSRIAKIWSGSTWQSTTYYVNKIINTSLLNQSSLMLNITSVYNGTATIEVKTRNSGGNVEVFSNYSLNVNYQSPPESQSQQY